MPRASAMLLAWLALAAGLQLQLLRRAPGVHRRVPFPPVCNEALSWQEALERILSPSTAQSDREVLLKDLLARGPEIRQQVADALSSGSIDALRSNSTKNSELARDLAAVRRQIVEDILPAFNPTYLKDAIQRVATDGPTLAQEAASSTPKALASLMQDPSNTLNRVQQEVRNVVSRTPEGIETPHYELVGEGKGYELRKYPSYGMVITPIAIKWDATSLALGFSFLASYLLGTNQRNEVMEMTTPLRIDVLPSGLAEMSFPLPSKYSAVSAPPPTDNRINLRQASRQSIAVSEFTGFPTEREVERQLSKLLDQLDRDGIQVTDTNVYSVYQYNPPYTLPWLRRNEITVPVVLNASMPEEDSNVDAEVEFDDDEP